MLPNTTANNFGVSMTTEASKTPEIHNAIKELEKEIYVLEESLQGLNTRLAPVMLPDVPVDHDAVKAPSISHSDVYLMVNGLRVKLTGLNIFLSNIKQRLEV